MPKSAVNPCHKNGRDCPQRSATCRIDCPFWARYTAVRDKGYADKLNNFAKSVDDYEFMRSRRIRDLAAKGSSKHVNHKKTDRGRNGC